MTNIYVFDKSISINAAHGQAKLYALGYMACYYAGTTTPQFVIDRTADNFAMKFSAIIADYYNGHSNNIPPTISTYFNEWWPKR